MEGVSGKITTRKADGLWTEEMRVAVELGQEQALTALQQLGLVPMK